MIAALSLLVKFGPWIGMALAGLAALFVHKNAQVKIAAAGQQVAQAQTDTAASKTQVAETENAEAQANATAAQTGEQAAADRQAIDAANASKSSSEVQSELDKWRQ